MEIQQKSRMSKQVKKSIIGRNKQGFTLLELTVSLFLLVILTLLLMLILQTTINTSKRFLDYSNYEYALAHRKILETYNNSAKVTQEKHYILMESKDDSEDVRINLIDNRIYIDKYKKSYNFAGFILLLKNLKELGHNIDLIITWNHKENNLFENEIPKGVNYEFLFDFYSGKNKLLKEKEEREKLENIEKEKQEENNETKEESDNQGE